MPMNAANASRPIPIDSPQNEIGVTYTSPMPNPMGSTVPMNPMIRLLRPNVLKSERSTSDPATYRKNSIPILMKSLRVLVTSGVASNNQS